MNGGAAVKYIGIALLIAAGFVLLTLGLAFLLFRLAFGARKTTEKEMFVLPDTDQYRPYAAEARRMIRAALALPYEPVTIRSASSGLSREISPSRMLLVIFWRHWVYQNDPY